MQAVIKEMPKKWLEERRASDASRWDEVWDGVLHMAPSPSMDHQEFAGALFYLLKQRWEPLSGERVYYEVNVTTPENEADWTTNFRVPDIVLLSPDRMLYRKKDFIAGLPLVCIEVHSPNDESLQKLPFYAGLGVPEVWIIDRDTKKPVVFLLKNAAYETAASDSESWIHSAAVGVTMKAENEKLLVRFGDEKEAAIVPN